MIYPTEVLTGMLAWSGGKIVGKTRLQKYAYLLDACGMQSGLEFDYYLYGPYSESLAIAAEDASLAGKIHADERLGSHQIPYISYSLRMGAEKPKALGRLSEKHLGEIFKVLERYTALDLEIASTVHYLHFNGHESDAVEETKRRKPLKATKEQIDRALKLLKELGL